jgi:hypothetical protein
MFSTRKLCLVVLVLSLLPVTAALGQTSRGSIAGTVADSSGAVVPDATVKIEQNETGLARSIVTTSAGVFEFAALPAGFYTVTVSHTGFQTQKIDNVEVQVARTTSLPVTLSVAQQAQTVEVTAATATIETNESALNAVVPARPLQDLPLNARDFTQLVFLTPGYNAYGSQNGSRLNQNNWQVDGVDNNDFWHNISAVNQGSISSVAGVLYPIDSIEEFNQQSVGGADFGRDAGSMVNIVTKQGTNSFHGTAYYFHRNDAFAKTSPFHSPGTSSELRNHNFGFSLGGPVVKDKLFFFLSFEGQRFIAAQSIQATAPSAAWVAKAETILTAFNVPVNPVMTTLLATLWPSDITSAPATSPNFSSGAPANARSNNGVARVDYAFSSNERLFVRGFVGTGDAVAFCGSVYGEYFQAVPSRQQNWAAVLSSTFTPRLTNQFIVGVNYFLQNFDDANHGANPPALGFQTGVTSTNFGTPNMEISGFGGGGVGETPDLGRTDTTWHLTDDLSYTFGRHALKFGGEFRRAKLFVHYLREARGGFFWDGTAGPWFVTGAPIPPEQALADFLAGFIATGNGAIAQGDPRRNYYVDSGSWYAHDNWQVWPRLNLNYGLRYDYNAPLYDPKHTISTFLPSAPVTAESPFGGLAFPPNTVGHLYPPDRNNFAPRLGFAFSPTRGGKTVIRGAWGIYYDIVNGNLFIDNRASPGGRGVARNPGGPNPVFTVSNTSLITVNPNQCLFGGTLPTCTIALSPAFGPFGVFAVNQNLESPYVQNFSLNVQHQLTPKVVFQAGYVGSQGRKLPVTRNINQPAANATPYPNLEAARPFHAAFPNFSGITELSSSGNSQYNSMQLSLRGTSWHGVTGQIAYTLAHARDDMSAARNNHPVDNNNLKGDYGNADFDTRHNVSGYVIYDLPQFGQSLPRLTKGWEFSALGSYNSGFPFSVRSGQGGSSDGSNTGNKEDRADLVGNPFSGVVQPAQPQGGLVNGVQWINPAAFALNAAGTFGNTKRNQFYGPRFKTIDFSVIKNTPITERLKTQFRVEMFNVFNILNLASPGGGNPATSFFNPVGFGGLSTCICDGGSFGLITSTVHGTDAPGIGPGEPFNVQFALKFIW